MLNSLRPITELEQVYPDIEGELCTRHSSTLSRLKQVFTDLYSCTLPLMQFSPPTAPLPMG